MILVTGSVRARADSIDEILALGLEHVRRSRLEPGCLLHSVHRDVEDPLRIVFVEHWADADGLRTHFAVSASIAFVTAVGALADGQPDLQVYEAEPTRI